MILLQVIHGAETVPKIFQERDRLEQSPPKDCYAVRPLRYSLDAGDEEEYRLVVDLPKSVSRKNLNVDIDYESSKIEILGYWMEQKVRGDRPKKMCAHREWTVDLDAVEQEPALSLYDLVMELQGQQVVLSLPKPSPAASPTLEEQQRYNSYNRDDDVDEEMEAVEQAVANASYAMAQNLWTMVRGLARLNSSLHSSNSTMWEGWNGPLSQESESVMAYLRSRQDALERFLKFSLGANDEESYWLKRM